MTMLSKYLSYDRATYSGNAVANGIKNVPDDRSLKALQALGENIYDKVVEKFGRVFPSSVFRSAALVRTPSGRTVSVNGLAGGSKTSGHTKGEAIDLDGDAPSVYWASVDNNVLFNWIRQNLDYDQLIAEYEANGRPKWIHVGFRAVGNRKQTLIAGKNTAGNTVYMLYSEKLYKQIYKGSRSMADTDDLLWGSEHAFVIPETDWQTREDEFTTEDFDLERSANREYNFPEEIELAQEILIGEGIQSPQDNFSFAETGEGDVVLHIGEFEISISVRKKD